MVSMRVDCTPPSRRHRGGLQVLLQASCCDVRCVLHRTPAIAWLPVCCSSAIHVLAGLPDERASAAAIPALCHAGVFSNR